MNNNCIWGITRSQQIQRTSMHKYLNRIYHGNASESQQLFSNSYQLFCTYILFSLPICQYTCIKLIYRCKYNYWSANKPWRYFFHIKWAPTVSQKLNQTETDCKHHALFYVYIYIYNNEQWGKNTFTNEHPMMIIYVVRRENN